MSSGSSLTSVILRIVNISEKRFDILFILQDDIFA